MGRGVFAGVNTCHVPTRKAHTYVFTIGRKWLTMITTEAERFQMHEALIHTHGKEVAAIIMEHLPPTGWGDVARRSDVSDLRSSFAKDMEILRLEMRSEMHVLFNKQLKWLVGVVITAQALGTGALLAGMKLL